MVAEFAYFKTSRLLQRSLKKIMKYDKFTVLHQLSIQNDIISKSLSPSQNFLTIFGKIGIQRQLAFREQILDLRKQNKVVFYWIVPMK